MSQRRHRQHPGDSMQKGKLRLKSSCRDVRRNHFPETWIPQEELQVGHFSVSGLTSPDTRTSHREGGQCSAHPAFRGFSLERSTQGCGGCHTVTTTCLLLMSFETALEKAVVYKGHSRLQQGWHHRRERKRKDEEEGREGNKRLKRLADSFKWPLWVVVKMRRGVVKKIYNKTYTVG